MVYDLPKIEALQIEKAHKNRLYRVERDRLKSRSFIYLNYSKINYHGLNISEARRYVYADFIARFERLIGRNVLFSIGYNNIDSSIYYSANKLDKPVYNYCASQYALYQKELKLLDISFDEEKEILFSSDEFVKYVQQIFLFLYDKNLIINKKGIVVHNEQRIFQKGEYLEKDGKFYDREGLLLKSSYRSHYVLKLNTLRKDIFKEINVLNIPNKIKEELLDYFCYRSELVVYCNTTTDEVLEIKVTNPEYLGGISYVCLNPNYMDIKPFITSDEEINIEKLTNDVSFIYTGTDLINPIISTKVPIFVSTRFEEAVHIGIPSLCDEEEIIVNELELDFNPVIDFINGERILVNSGRFNGLYLDEANHKITKYLLDSEVAVEFKDIKLDEIIISSNIKFGIPVPLHSDLTPAVIPVVYNLKHDVKLEGGQLSEKSFVKEFLTDEFVKNLLPNAIRLKNEMGILDFESIDALDEIGLFSKADVALIKSYDYLNELVYSIIFNKVFARYYTTGFDCEFKKILFVEPITDKNLLIMHRDNNNLVSVSSIISQYGSTVLRGYYASMGLEDGSTIYNLEDIEEILEITDKIIKVFYHPIDETCVELDIAYQRMVDLAYISAVKCDFNSYFTTIISFIKKVHEIKHISRAQAKGLLIILSVIMPAFSEQIKEDVLNLREPLYYFSWPV